MPKAGTDYSPKTFRSLTQAYRRYERDRLAETTNPTLAPRKKFAQVWGWAKTPGRTARLKLEK
jgi:hypothetical protein